MAISSSVIVEISVQSDGRRWVREVHTDSFGIQYGRQYLATAILDLNAALAAYATILDSNNTLQEIAANVSSVLINGSSAIVTFNYSTAGQNRTALREAYRNSTRVEAIMLGDFLSSLTDGQLQTIFSMTSGQVTTLRTNKLTPAATQAAAIRVAAGQ